MKHFWDEYLKFNIPFFILGGISIILLIVSWLAPPPWEIHKTVIEAVGLIFAFAALWTVVIAIERGTGASIKKGDIELEIKDDTKREEE